MNIEQLRAKAKKLFADAGIAVLPYGNAWWVVGQGINQVVGELAGVNPSDLPRYQTVQR